MPEDAHLANIDAQLTALRAAALKVGANGAVQVQIDGTSITYRSSAQINQEIRRLMQERRWYVHSRRRYSFGPVGQ